MAKFSYPVLFIAAILLAALPQFSGQSMSPGEAPSPAVDCMPYFFNVSDCVSFVTPGSTLTEPEPGCCTGFATLVNEQPICLCQLMANSTSLGVDIDVNRALLLSNVCNVITPPSSACTVGFPASPSPAPSPTPFIQPNSASTKHFMIGSAAALLMYFI